MRIDESTLDDPRRAVTCRSDGLLMTAVFLVIFAANVAVGVHTILTQEPVELGLSLLLMSLPWLLVAWLCSAFTRIEVDEARRTLDVLLVRWPWASRKGTFPLDAVRDAVVHRHGQSKGPPTYSVQLVLEGQDSRVTILERRSVDSGPLDHVAARVQAMLGRGGDTKASWE